MAPENPLTRKHHRVKSLEIAADQPIRITRAGPEFLLDDGAVRAKPVILVLGDVAPLSPMVVCTVNPLPNVGPVTLFAKRPMMTGKLFGGI